MAKKLNIYEQYVKDNLKEICFDINNIIYDSKEKIRKQLIAKIKEYLEDEPIHYEIDYSECTYDWSGELIDTGEDVDMTQTVSNFLHDEYIGSIIATYEHGRGFNYPTYGEELEYTTLDIVDVIMKNYLYNRLKENFDNIDENLNFEDFYIDVYDEVYSNSEAFSFGCYEFPIRFTDIKDMTLEEVMNEK